MLRHEIVDAKFAAIAALTRRGHVALGCCMVEHTFDLYRVGPTKYRAEQLAEGTLSIAPDKDVLELSLELAWRFVESDSHDPAVTTALIGFLKTAKSARAKGPELLLPGLGPINGAIDTLTAITGDSAAAIKGATGRTGLGISRLVMIGLDDDDPVPDKEEDEESAWQLRVAQRLVTHGDKPLDRALVADLLAESLTWRTRLEDYAAKCRELVAR